MPIPARAILKTRMPGGLFAISGCTEFSTELSSLTPLTGIQPAFLCSSSDVLTGEEYIF